MLIRHTLLYLPAQIIGPVAQFVAIVVFTHWLAPEPYGVLTYVMASQDLVFFLCLSWWSQYTVRYFGDHACESESGYRRSEFTIMLGTVAAQVLASVLVILPISTTRSAGLFVATVLFMVTRCFNLHLGERARAQGRFLDYTVASAAGPVLGLALAYAAIVSLDAKPTEALIGYAIAQTLSLVWLFRRQDIEVALRAPDPALLRRALSFGFPLIAAGLAAWIGLNAIRVMVDREIGAEAMGLIAVGWSLGHRLTSTAAMFVTVAAFPLAVKSFSLGSRDHAFEQLTANGLLMFALVLPAAVGLYLLQQPLVALLVAEPFRATTLAILPAALAAGLFRNMRTHVADQVFILIERTDVVCVMTIIEAVLVVVGCGIGLAIDNAVGAALGSAIGYGIAMVLNFIMAHLKVGLRLPIFATGAIATAVIVMAAVISILPPPGSLPGGPMARIVIVILVGASTYIAAVLALFPAVTRGLWMHGKRFVTGRA